METVVLLHGWGGSARISWSADWTTALAATGRRAVAIDLPGHGGPESADPADYADLAGLVAVKLPGGPMDLVGFSLGAKLALALAVREPARFGRIVLGGVGDNLFAPEPAAGLLADALLRGVDAATPLPLAQLATAALASGGTAAAMAAVLRRPPNPVLAPEQLGGLGPVLLVNGAEDPIALPDTRLRAALGAPACRHLDGVGHADLIADPRFHAAVLDFLR